MRYILYTDGGARNNPGPAAAGAVLYKIENRKSKIENENAEKVGEWGKYLGEATNNQAEYQALILGLEQAKAHRVEELQCFLDSELLVKQMKHEYRVKNKDLAPLFVKAYNLATSFKNITFTHVPREQNQEADAMVNKAIDEYLKK